MLAKASLLNVTIILDSLDQEREVTFMETFLPLQPTAEANVTTETVLP